MWLVSEERTKSSLLTREVSRPCNSAQSSVHLRAGRREQQWTDQTSGQQDSSGVKALPAHLEEKSWLEGRTCSHRLPSDAHMHTIKHRHSQHTKYVVVLNSFEEMVRHHCFRWQRSCVCLGRWAWAEGSDSGVSLGYIVAVVVWVFCFVLSVFSLDYVRLQKQEANEGRMKRSKESIFSQPN